MKVPLWLPFGLLGALALAIWVAVWAVNEAKIAKAELGRQEEAHELEVAGIQQAHAVEARDLKAKESLAQRRLGEALKAAGVKGTTIATVTGTTGPVQAGGAAPSGPAPATAPADPSAAGPGRACLLYEGEQGEIRVSGAAARTEAGNVAIDAQADAYGAGRHLFGGQLHLDARYLKPERPDRDLGLGIGLAAVGGRDGLMLGPGAALPTLDLWLFRLDTSVGLTFGNGSWAATGTALVRRAR